MVPLPQAPVNGNANGTELINSPSQARKRASNPQMWKKKQAKQLRNAGQEYTSVVTKQTVAAKKIGAACGCTSKCFEKVGMDNIKLIFNDFYASGCWDMQTCYIQNQTITTGVKRRRTDNEEKMKSCTRSYYVKQPGVINNIKVCKKAFASIHGISVARIDRAHANKTASNIPIKDRRGKYGSHNKVSQERAAKVIQLIKSFLTLTSHYSRKTLPTARYLDTEIRARSQMYDLYKEWLEEEFWDEVPVTWHYYDDTLKSQFPYLKLYKPRKDTCKLCDIYNIKSADTTLSETYKTELENTHNHHILKAEKGYELPKKLAGMR